MKILLYSSVFYPSTGGIETISATLAKNITQLGHECIVITETPLNTIKEKQANYQVIRQPNWRKRLAIARECSLIHANGSSVAMYFYARLAKKPFIWTHNGYQISCVDGLGWVDGVPTPMTPGASLKYYLQSKGWLYFLKEALKLTLRRYIANYVDLNIACTNWVAQKQPLPNQIVAYTPYPLKKFQQLVHITKHIYDFIYVGRLVSEKGVSDLIKAFHKLVSQAEYQDKNLVIVGDGNLRQDLEELVNKLNLEQKISFLGSKRNQALLDVINQAKIAVVPSVWEEPMGGVALELLAANKNLIVSASGGHAECVGDAALKFRNGDVDSLYNCMKKLLTEPSLAKQQQAIAKKRIELFDEVKLTQKYLELYADVINSV